tara:strand:- start:2159 stop:2803 length:645 start_codon:yes stop_codon:yes gene_type:complete
MTGKIKLVHSGGNAVSIAVPTSNPSASEVEFKLPQSDGSSGQRIVTDGSGNLSFASAGASGKVLQTLFVEKSNTASHTGSSRGQVGLSLNITPSATTSKILIMSVLHVSGDAGQYAYAFYLQRDSTDISRGDASGSRTRMTMGGLTDSSSEYMLIPHTHSYLDSPNTTSQVTYSWEWNDPFHNKTIYLNRSYEDTNDAYTPRLSSNMIIQEIAA